MKHSVLLRYLAGMILLLILAVPTTAELSTITSISPAVGYTGSSTTVTITGTNFNTSSVTVRLMMEDENNITAADPTTLTDTSIVCKFTISSSKTTGDWDLVVINEDGSEVVKSEGFSIRDPMVLTSISPTYARTNNESVDVTLVGTGLADVSDLYLYNEDYDNITASNVDAVSSTKVTGSFDLTDEDEASYEVCVMDSFSTRKCGLSFEITTDAVGSIDISSSPTGASIYVDSAYMGTTPDSVEDLDIGSHKVILKKTGYTDWGKLVKVTEGGTTTVDADLEAITISPTPLPTTVPTTVKITQKVTTAKVPTAWPSSTTATTNTTQESPLDGAVVLGAIGLGIVVLRRKY
jgi:hypothetical protein